MGQITFFWYLSFSRLSWATSPNSHSDCSLSTCVFLLIIAWWLRKGANEAQKAAPCYISYGIYLCKAHARRSCENDIICVLNTGAFFSLVTSLFARENGARVCTKAHCKLKGAREIERRLWSQWCLVHGLLPPNNGFSTLGN
jgi:hypothetical protein